MTAQMDTFEPFSIFSKDLLPAERYLISERLILIDFYIFAQENRKAAAKT